MQKQQRYLQVPNFMKNWVLAGKSIMKSNKALKQFLKSYALRNTYL